MQLKEIIFYHACKETNLNSFSEDTYFPLHRETFCLNISALHLERPLMFQVVNKIFSTEEFKIKKLSSKRFLHFKRHKIQIFQVFVTVSL